MPRHTEGRPEPLHARNLNFELDEVLRTPGAPSIVADQAGEIIDELGPKPKETPEAGNKHDMSPERIVSPVDFEGIALCSAKIAELVDEIEKIESPSGSVGVYLFSRQVIAELRRFSPDALPKQPLEPGAKGVVLSVLERTAQIFLRLAARELMESADEVLWDDGVNQIVVKAGEMSLKLAESQLTVLIPVEHDRGTQVIAVPFATGGKDRQAGLVLATTDRPLGDASVARIWGDGLVALAHNALLSVVGSLASASGKDGLNNDLLPRSLRVIDGVLQIETEARSRFRENSK